MVDYYKKYLKYKAKYLELQKQLGGACDDTVKDDIENKLDNSCKATPICDKNGYLKEFTDCKTKSPMNGSCELRNENKECRYIWSKEEPKIEEPKIEALKIKAPKKKKMVAKKEPKI